jgi:spore germination cell wall hydrolase CwlJ-like protein
MEAQPYGNLSELALLALCCYREARGETLFGKRAVCHVIKNRVSSPGWWGHDIVSVILKPWQFSSFNEQDPNSQVWPADEAPAWTDCLSAASAVLVGDDPDNTDGALYYHDVSMGWPANWGKESDFVNTLNIGRLRFYKPIRWSI